MFKYNIGQTVWYLLDNKVHSAKIGARTTVEVDSEFQKTRTGSSWSPKLLYVTVDGCWREDNLFSSIDHLLSHLRSNAVVR